MLRRKKKKTATHDKLLFSLSLPYGFLLRWKYCAKKWKILICIVVLIYCEADGIYILSDVIFLTISDDVKECAQNKRNRGRGRALLQTANSQPVSLLHIPTSEFKHARFVSNILGITHLWQDSHAHYLERSQCQTSFPQSQQLTLYDVKEYKNNHRVPSQ